jgi:peroxiredoxin
MLLMFAGVVGCGQQGPPQTSDEAVGTAPKSLEFTLASLDGGSVSMSDFEGQVVLIDFWATWCGPCHFQADILRNIHEEFATKGVQFLAVSLGEPEDVVRKFVDENPYPYPVLVDPEDQLSLELGIYVLPTVMVIDGDGRISFSRPGVTQEQALRRALYEAGVEHPATAARDA